MILGQISDLHIKTDGKKSYRVVDTAESLRRCVAQVNGLKQRPDALVITGDLVDFGKPSEYACLRELLAPLAMARRSVYRKVRERASFAFALVSVAAALEVRDGVVEDCRMALGAVAHAPWRADRAEAALRGAPATEASFAAAADAELAEARPLRENAYKVPLARSLLIRTLADLAQDAR